MPVSANEQSRVRKSDGKKRVVTAARREQNRLAQRAWRQRQREIHGQKNEDVQRVGLVSESSMPAPVSSSVSSSQGNGILDTSYEKIEEAKLKASTSYVINSSDCRNVVTRRGSSPLSLTSPDASSESSSSSQDWNLFNEVIERQPDLKINTLQTSETRTLLAIFNNATCLGFDIDKLMRCSKGDLSPFYRSIKPTDDPHDMIASALNPSIPIHLQPTFAQMLIPHHPALDLVPLPLVRDRLIMLAFAMPNVYDLWDLKLDIYVRHGLGLKSDSGDYLSWDRRSWKMESWFVDKWGISVCE